MSTEVLRYAAFTDGVLGGNPAGVVLGAGSLTDAEMLAIAAAIGFSETAFVVAGPTSRSSPASSTSAPQGWRGSTRRAGEQGPVLRAKRQRTRTWCCSLCTGAECMMC